MNSITRRSLVAGVALLAAFALLTVLVQLVDVRPVGQNGTNVGFATFNIWFHGLTGVHMRTYTITDWLGLVPIAIDISLLQRRGLGFRLASLEARNAVSPATSREHSPEFPAIKNP